MGSFEGKKTDLVIVACNTFITTSKRNFKCTRFYFGLSATAEKNRLENDRQRHRKKNMSNNLLLLKSYRDIGEKSDNKLFARFMFISFSLSAFASISPSSSG